MKILTLGKYVFILENRVKVNIILLSVLMKNPRCIVKWWSTSC